MIYGLWFRWQIQREREKCQAKKIGFFKGETRTEITDFGQPKPLVINIHLRKCSPPTHRMSTGKLFLQKHNFEHWQFDIAKVISSD